MAARIAPGSFWSGLFSTWWCVVMTTSSQAAAASARNDSQASRNWPQTNRNRDCGEVARAALDRVHAAWRNMLYRCYDHGDGNFQNYGGRGITVCTRWFLFDHFLSDMGFPPYSGMSLDRIDNDGNYEPSNCRWATSFEQNRNTRRNVYFLVDGNSLTLAELARESGVRADVLHRRLRRGIGLVIAKNNSRVKKNKLCADDVASIRSLLSGGTPVTEISRRFGISGQMVRLIRANKAWVSNG
jgi:hypothetical protein